jgi:hypothetical protein
MFGAVIGILGLLWGILWLHDDPLEEGFKEAREWESRQKRLRKVLGK